jgi:hypothetical protein
MTDKERSGGDILTEYTNDEQLMSFVSFAIFSAVIDTCAAVRQAVFMAGIYREEDFFPGQCSVTLDLDLTSEGTMSILSSAEKALMERRKLLENEDQNTESIFSVRGCSVLLNIIGFRKAFRGFFCEMEKPECKGIAEAGLILQNLKKSWVLAGPDRADEQVTQKELENRAKVLKSGIIDASINRKVLAMLPRREGPSVDFAITHAYFAKMLEDLDSVCELEKEISLFGLYSALSNLSSRNPCIISRSLVIPLLCSESKLVLGKYDYKILILENMYQFGIPDVDISTSACQDFAEAMVKPVYDILQLCVANRVSFVDMMLR